MCERDHTGDERPQDGVFADLEQCLAEATVDDLAADHPLGVLHQTLLRSSLSRSSRRQLKKETIRNAVLEYWASPPKRHALLNELRETDQSAKQSNRLKRERSSCVKRQARAVPITKAYRAGHFMMRPPIGPEEAHLKEINNLEDVSIRAAMALYTDPVFEPEIAVVVLAGTLKWIAGHGLPNDAGRPWPIRELQRELLEHLPTDSFHDDAWFEDACARILNARNAGHILSGRAEGRIREMLAEVDVPPEIVGSLDSARDRDLGAWSRLCEGGGFARDPAFVLADIIANLVAVRTLDEAPQNLLRALNWAYVPVNLPAGQPTGAALFQHFSMERQFRGLQNLVGDLFRLFHLAPSAAANKLVEVEAAAWLLLRERAVRRGQP